MLMTHGQTLLEHPEFLEALVVEGGLRQVAVHIDMTQAGRHGFPINRLTSESDLHPVRESFTKLAAQIRKRTGLPLELAHNCTVTERNIDSVAEVVRWFLADPARSRIWRILSFQPEANTGRTIFSEHPVTPAIVWQKLCEGMGLALGWKRLPRRPSGLQPGREPARRTTQAGDISRFCLTTRKRNEFLPRSWPRSARSRP